MGSEPTLATQLNEGPLTGDQQAALSIREGRLVEGLTVAGRRVNWLGSGYAVWLTVIKHDADLDDAPTIRQKVTAAQTGRNF